MSDCLLQKHSSSLGKEIPEGLADLISSLELKVKNWKRKKKDNISFPDFTGLTGRKLTGHIATLPGWARKPPAARAARRKEAKRTAVSHCLGMVCHPHQRLSAFCTLISAHGRYQVTRPVATPLAWDLNKNNYKVIESSDDGLLLHLCQDICSRLRLLHLSA